MTASGITMRWYERCTRLTDWCVSMTFVVCVLDVFNMQWVHHWCVRMLPIYFTQVGCVKLLSGDAGS
jgi:hypothetical protein